MSGLEQLAFEGFLFLKLLLQNQQAHKGRHTYMSEANKNETIAYQH